MTDLYHLIGDHLRLYIGLLLAGMVVVVLALLLGTTLLVGIYLWGLFIIMIFAVLLLKEHYMLLP